MTTQDPGTTDLLVSVADVMQDLRIDALSPGDDYDAQVAEIEDFILMAQSEEERISGSILGNRTLTDYHDCFPTGNTITLNAYPVTAFTSVEYVTDEAGATAAMSSSLYTVDTVSKPARVVLNSTNTWASTAEVANAVRLNYTAGYTSATLPAIFRALLLENIRARYENRDGFMTREPHVLYNLRRSVKEQLYY